MRGLIAEAQAEEGAKAARSLRRYVL